MSKIRRRRLIAVKQQEKRPLHSDLSMKKKQFTTHNSKHTNDMNEKFSFFLLPMHIRPLDCLIFITYLVFIAHTRLCSVYHHQCGWFGTTAEAALASIDTCLSYNTKMVGYFILENVQTSRLQISLHSCSCIHVSNCNMYLSTYLVSTYGLCIQRNIYIKRSVQVHAYST